MWYINGLLIASLDSTEISNDSVGEKGNFSEIHLNIKNQAIPIYFVCYYYRDRNHNMCQVNNPM